MEEVLILVIAIGLTYWIFRTLRNKLNAQQAVMRQLATTHGWEFVQAPAAASFRGIADLTGLEQNAFRVQYLIRGVTYVKEFELILLVGSPKLHFNSSYGSAAIGYVTIARTKQPLSPPANLPPQTYVATFDDWNCIVYTANAMSDEQVNALLDLLR